MTQMQGDEYFSIQNEITELENKIRPNPFARSGPNIAELFIEAYKNIGTNEFGSGNFEDITPQFRMQQRSSAASETSEMQLRVGQLRKLIQLKKLILFLQPPSRNIGDFCNYGCHCLPRGTAEINFGQGQPVDETDKSCMIHHKCHICAKLEFSSESNKCDPSITNYSFELKYHKDDPYNIYKRDIICNDDWETKSCQRSVCECDRGLAIKLRETQSTYDSKFHHRQNPSFDFDEMCHKKFLRYTKENSASCCGSYHGGNRVSFNPGQHQCCHNLRIFDTNIHQCCEDGKIGSFGVEC